MYNLMMKTTIIIKDLICSEMPTQSGWPQTLQLLRSWNKAIPGSCCQSLPGSPNECLENV